MIKEPCSAEKCGLILYEKKDGGKFEKIVK
jgi:hypothetical protein